ncbi:MAG TPA: hypothetical protein VE733_23940 [Streptosporangiaceae bacterium]|jgi:hypothetical protein|nr:hypothetical protein [Streptosporangiaceae bacterium]
MVDALPADIGEPRREAQGLRLIFAAEPASAIAVIVRVGRIVGLLSGLILNPHGGILVPGPQDVLADRRRDRFDAVVDVRGVVIAEFPDDDKGTKGAFPTG